jgi:hypothetical protein
VWFGTGVLVAAVIGIWVPGALTWLVVGSGIGLGVALWRIRLRGFQPQSDHDRTLAKLRKKRLKTENKKHRHIHDQISHIAAEWGYTKEQAKIIDRFIETRAYGEIYNHLTASLLPQIILLIDNCNARDRKGCKRDVSRRLRALTDLMQEQTRRQRSQKHENFATALEVYDQLLSERLPKHL